MVGDSPSRKGLTVELSLQTINWVALPSNEAQIPRATVPLEEILNAASEAGFKHIGVETITLDQQEVEAKKLAEMLKTRDLTCTDIGILTVSTQDCREEATRLGSLAAQVGATVCITALSEQPTPAVITRLRECGQILGYFGVTIALEFLPYGPLATLDQCLAICQQIGWSRCGVLLDTWHVFHSPPAWQQLARLDPAYIALVQINDAPPPVGHDLIYESRFRRLPPGVGTFDLERFNHILRSVGYEGIVSPEVLSTALRQQSTKTIAQTLYSSSMQTGILG